MRKYVNRPMAELAAELAAGLLRLRKGYIDAAERLIRIIEPGRGYPYEFIVYRLSGYHPRRPDLSGEPISGESLRADLLKLMLDICDSFELSVSDYSSPAYDITSLAKRFRISTKTVQRWRRRGLPARRLSFPDGKRRVAFLESSVRWFVGDRRRQILRSIRFTQMSLVERDQIIRRARRMATVKHCCLSDVARRLAKRTGRAAETIRYTIRKHDLEHPEQAVFPYLSAPLGDQEKTVIYRCFLSGVSVPVLAERYNRTRGSIYRVINEIRASQLLDRPIAYMYNPQFDLPGAEQIVLASKSDGPSAAAPAGKKPRAPKPSESLPPYLRALYDVPLLDVAKERDLFRRYNFLKHQADVLRKKIDLNRIRTGQLRHIEALLLQANAVKNQIIRANLRLVVSIAKKHVGGPQTLFELISDGNVSLMRAVEKFDYSRGNRFSTYASWAIMRNFARSIPKERYQLDRFATGHEGLLDIAAAMRIYDPNEVNLPELRESIDAVFTRLSPTERRILVDHYGLDEASSAKTFNQLGQYLGLSKERVRQIEVKALKKLRKILHPQEADLLS